MGNRKILGRKGVKTSAKPSLVSRIGRKIGSGMNKVKSRISRSFIGKTYRGIVKTVKFVVGAVKKIAKVIGKTAVATWRTAKAAVKTFWRASKAVGRGVHALGKGIVRKVKNVVKLAKEGKLKDAILNFSGAKIVTNLGWKAVKFVGKKIWKGIKALGLKIVGFTLGLFGMIGKFVNKVATWV